jgi:hypothetical protein
VSLEVYQGMASAMPQKPEKITALAAALTGAEARIDVALLSGTAQAVP